MDLNGAERAELAERLQLEERVRFRGVAKRAYSAAKVNSTTWARAISGLSIKRQTRIAIVGNLWPETQGDWTAIPPEPVGPEGEDDEYVASPGAVAIPGVTDEEVLRELRDMQRRLEDLSERLAQHAKQGSESLGGTGGETAPDPGPSADS